MEYPTVADAMIETPTGIAFADMGSDSIRGLLDTPSSRAYPATYIVSVWVYNGSIIRPPTVSLGERAFGIMVAI